MPRVWQDTASGHPGAPLPREAPSTSRFSACLIDDSSQPISRYFQPWLADCRPKVIYSPITKYRETSLAFAISRLWGVSRRANPFWATAHTRRSRKDDYSCTGGDWGQHWGQDQIFLASDHRPRAMSKCSLAIRIVCSRTYLPPVTSRKVPVTNEASALASHKMARATSSG